MTKTPKPIEEIFEEQARAGNGSFAIAFAVLKLVEEQERMATKIGYLGFDCPGSLPQPGALEFIGMQMREIASKLDHLTISAAVDINNV